MINESIYSKQAKGQTSPESCQNEHKLIHFLRIIQKLKNSHRLESLNVFISYIVTREILMNV